MATGLGAAVVGSGAGHNMLGRGISAALYRGRGGDGGGQERRSSRAADLVLPLLGGADPPPPGPSPHMQLLRQ